MFVDYLPGESLLHRLDVRTKVLGLLTVIVWSFLFEDPLYNVLLMLGIVLITVQSNIPYKKVLKLIRPLVPICLFLFLISGFTYPPERFHSEMSQVVLFSALPDGRLALSVGGVLTGVNFICRLLVMVLASSVLTLTTPMDDFMQFLNQLRVPSEISFMITTALRFIPTLDKKRSLILEAQRARGAKINDKGSLGRIKAYIPIMVPLFVNSILIAEDLAKGMLNRGYGFARTMTNMRELHLAVRDYCIMGMLFLMIVGGFYLRIGLRLGLL